MAVPVIRAILLIALATPSLATPALAQPARPRALQALLDYHAAACAAQGGTLTVPDDAVVPAALFGPGTPALMLDSARLSCSTATAMFCAPEIGCELNLFVDETQHSLIVRTWSLVPDDDRDLLQVTIAGSLLNQPQDMAYRMTWDPEADALIVID